MTIRRQAVLVVALAIGGCAGQPGAGATPEPAPSSRGVARSALDDLISAERAFAARSTSHGMRAAFLEYLGEDAVLFIPRASPGRPFFESQPRTGQGRLDWAPIYAEVSRAGDLGFTTGPYEARAKPGVDSVTAYGNFVSIWTRDPLTYAWKVALDLGTTNERPAAADRLSAARGASVRTRVQPAISDTTSGVGDSSVYPLRADDLFIERATLEGTAAAFDAADPDVRLYRDGREPIKGAAAAIATLRNLGERFAWYPSNSVEAQSSDIGYTYGTYGPAIPGAAELGAYVRIWRRGPTGRWRLALDITNPFPP